MSLVCRRPDRFEYMEAAPFVILEIEIDRIANHQERTVFGPNIYSEPMLPPSLI
jgi:hypothetical protein